MSKNRTEERSVEEVWLSLEQVAQVLSVPWATVRGWARDGDPRMPAYKVWEAGDEGNGRFRFKKSDVEAFQAMTAANGAASHEAVAEPAPPRKRASRAAAREVDPG